MMSGGSSRINLGPKQISHVISHVILIFGFETQQKNAGFLLRSIRDADAYYAMMAPQFLCQH